MFFTNLNLENFESIAPLDCEKQVLEKYSSHKQKLTITLIGVNKGQEKLSLAEKREKLGSADAHEIVQLMKDSYPEMWSE